MKRMRKILRVLSVGENFKLATLNLQLVVLLFFFTVALSLLTALPAWAETVPSWDPERRLSDSDPSASAINFPRSIAANGDNIHVVWSDYRDGNGEIYYKRSTDGGLTWGLDTRLTNDPQESYDPRIAISGSNIHVIWGDDSAVYYKQSVDNGATWGTDTTLYTGWVRWLNIAANGSNIHVIANRSWNGIVYKRSTDNGQNWSPETLLFYADPNYPVRMTVSGNNIHLGWIDQGGAGQELYYTRSIDNGLSWESKRKLADGYVSSSDIVANGSYVHLVWADNRDAAEEIYYKRSTDNGASWEADTRLTYDSAWSNYPSIAASDNNVYIVWQDERISHTKPWFKRSADNGATWGADTVLTTVPWLINGGPSVAASAGKIHVVWTDDRAGSWEVYYRRGVEVADTTPPTTTASPAGGTYALAQSVTLSCTDTGGSGCTNIYYTTDGSTPTTSSSVYSGAISISTTTTLKFFAKDNAGNSESVKTETYLLTCPSSIVSYWKFNEGSGTAANDSVGTNSGTINGAIWTSGMVGGALSFDGVDDDVTIPISSSLQITNVITVEIRVKPTASVQGTIIDHISGAWIGNIHYNPTAESLWINIDIGGSLISFFADTPVSNNNWHHIVYTYDGSYERWYVDGTQTASRANSGGISLGGYNLIIGGFTPGPSSKFNGIVDEVAIYNTPLSASEIQQHYANGLNGIGYCFVYDTTPPTGLISINSGAASTNSTSVTLTLSCSDASGCSQMQFNDNSTWSTAEAYATSKSWTLSSGDGTKTVYVKFKDGANNWSSAYSDTIVLDTTAPTTTASPAGGTYATAQSVTLSCNDGSGSGCTNIYYLS